MVTMIKNIAYLKVDKTTSLKFLTTRKKKELVITCGDKCYLHIEVIVSKYTKIPNNYVLLLKLLCQLYHDETGTTTCTKIHKKKLKIL